MKTFNFVVSLFYLLFHVIINFSPLLFHFLFLRHQIIILCKSMFRYLYVAFTFFLFILQPHFTINQTYFLIFNSYSEILIFTEVIECLKLHLSLIKQVFSRQLFLKLRYHGCILNAQFSLDSHHYILHREVAIGLFLKFAF